jgi:hypothetical protein
METMLLVIALLADPPTTASAPEVGPCAAAWAAEGAPKPLESNCQAPLAVTEEVLRLMAAAAAHGTRSSACIDGPGQRVSIDEVRVCPSGGTDDGYAVQVSYCVTVFREGDTRGCGSVGDCSWLKPRATVHLASFTFAKAAKGFKLVLPKQVPGLDGKDDALSLHAVVGTPLDQPHDGRCYGKSAAFVAKVLAELR